MAVIEPIDVNPSAVVAEVTKHLMQLFDGLKVTIYNLMKTECNLSVKQVEFYSVERNSPEKIEDRHDWVRKREQTDMDFLTSLHFI